MLDEALRGGMPCGRLTELVGPAGVGKTQLCFTLAVAAATAAPPVGGMVVYLDVEHKFSAGRVYQLATALVPSLQANPQAMQDAMVNIKVVKPTSSSDLLHSLQVHSLQLIPLIIIASTGAPGRGAPGRHSADLARLYCGCGSFRVWQRGHVAAATSAWYASCSMGMCHHHRAGEIASLLRLCGICQHPRRRHQPNHHRHRCTRDS